MMGDLVQRMREIASGSSLVNYLKYSREAADEIERLRADALTGLRREAAFAERAEKQDAEIKRLRQCLRWQDDRDGHIGTHSAECYTFGNRHYECALREIERLRAELAAEKDEVFRVQCEYSALHHKWAELLYERDALIRKLRTAEIKLSERAHPVTDPRDSPEVLASTGFWPECGCDACYAIHCLRNALAERDALRADAERWRWWRNRWPALCRMDVARFAGLDLSRVHVQGPGDMDAVTDAAMAGTTGGET
jgi:hypothetical protein